MEYLRQPADSPSRLEAATGRDDAAGTPPLSPSRGNLLDLVCPIFVSPTKALNAATRAKNELDVVINALRGRPPGDVGLVHSVVASRSTLLALKSYNAEESLANLSQQSSQAVLSRASKWSLGVRPTTVTLDPCADVLALRVPPQESLRFELIHNDLHPLELSLDTLGEDAHCLRLLHTAMFDQHMAVLYEPDVGAWALVLLAGRAYRHPDRMALVQPVRLLSRPQTPLHFPLPFNDASLRVRESEIFVSDFWSSACRARALGPMDAAVPLSRGLAQNIRNVDLVCAFLRDTPLLDAMAPLLHPAPPGHPPPPSPLFSEQRVFV